MDKKLTIAVDVDGVLRYNLQTMLDLYNRTFGNDLIPDDIKSFDVSVSFPDIEKYLGEPASTWFFQKHSTEIFRDAPMMDRADSGMELLREIADVVVITYQKSFQNKIHTLEWLENNLIGYDGLYFTKDKSKLKCDWLVDDFPDNFVGCNAEHGALITAPYNVDIDLNELKKKSGCKDIVRFRDFRSFVDRMRMPFLVYGKKMDDSVIFTGGYDSREEAVANCVRLNSFASNYSNRTIYFIEENL